MNEITSIGAARFAKAAKGGGDKGSATVKDLLQFAMDRIDAVGAGRVRYIHVVMHVDSLDATKPEEGDGVGLMVMNKLSHLENLGLTDLLGMLFFGDEDD